MGFYSFEGLIDSDEYEKARRGLNKYNKNSKHRSIKTFVKGDLLLLPKNPFFKGRIDYHISEPCGKEFLYGRYNEKPAKFWNLFGNKTILEFFAETTHFEKQIYLQVKKNSIDKTLKGKYSGYWWYVDSDYVNHRLDMFENKPDEFFQRLGKNTLKESGYANIKIVDKDDSGDEPAIFEPLPNLVLH